MGKKLAEEILEKLKNINKTLNPSLEYKLLREIDWSTQDRASLLAIKNSYIRLQKEDPKNNSKYQKDIEKLDKLIKKTK